MSLVSLGPEDDEHLVPFHPWPRFYFPDVRQMLFQLRQNSRAKFPVRHFASAEPDGGLYLIPFLRPLARGFHAVVVIVIVRAGAKRCFLDRNRDLLLLGLIRLFLGFVLKLSKVDDATRSEER